LVIEVKSFSEGAYDSEVIYTINGFMLADHLNVLNATAKVYSHNNRVALLGLGSPDLWINDGKYSLWTSNESPRADNFMMGKTPTTETWFGVFSNNPAAQDWKVKHAFSNDTGLVNLHSIASGGVGDLFFFVGIAPNKITDQYQTLIGKQRETC